MSCAFSVTEYFLQLSVHGSKKNPRVPSSDQPHRKLKSRGTTLSWTTEKCNGQAALASAHSGGPGDENYVSVYLVFLCGFMDIHKSTGVYTNLGGKNLSPAGCYVVTVCKLLFSSKLGVLQGKSMHTCNYHKVSDESSAWHRHDQFLASEGDLKPIPCICKWTPL